MKLSELDKSKLPVKVMNATTGQIYNILYVGELFAFCNVMRQEDVCETKVSIDSDNWSLLEQPKTKVALYMFKRIDMPRWFLTELFHKDDDAFKTALHIPPNVEYKRLMWSEVEV